MTELTTDNFRVIGLLTGTTIMCQCHGSEFDVTTGAVVNVQHISPFNVYGVQSGRRQHLYTSMTAFQRPHSRKVTAVTHAPVNCSAVD